MGAAGLRRIRGVAATADQFVCEVCIAHRLEDRVVAELDPSLASTIAAVIEHSRVFFSEGAAHSESYHARILIKFRQRVALARATGIWFRNTFKGVDVQKHESDPEEAIGA
jgi:hypothetical protein